MRIVLVFTIDFLAIFYGSAEDDNASFVSTPNPVNCPFLPYGILKVTYYHNNYRLI